MCVEERREMRNQLRRYDYVLDFVEPNVITGWFVGRRRASVILTRATSMVRPLAQTRSPPIPRTPIVARHIANVVLFHYPIDAYRLR